MKEAEGRRQKTVKEDNRPAGYDASKPAGRIYLSTCLLSILNRQTTELGDFEEPDRAIRDTFR